MGPPVVGAAGVETRESAVDDEVRAELEEKVATLACNGLTVASGGSGVARRPWAVRSRGRAR